jgi:ankyrin repeat protein
LLVSAGAGPYSAVGVVYTTNPAKLLLERGANIEERNKHGDTALILAASKVSGAVISKE